jgi:SAM-dependent methyltransferase
VTDLSAIYDKRFRDIGLAKRQSVWKILCKDFFQKILPGHATILDLGCGYGEFINNIQGVRKCAIDLNPDSPTFLSDDVRFERVPATDLSVFEEGFFDVVFTSNFLEHLRDKDQCDQVFREVRRVLKPGGRFIVMGPNIRYAYREYWDFYDHYLPLSHLSLSEGLHIAGFDIERVIARFLPYTMKGRAPTADFLVKIYLRVPAMWPLFGKQFLVIAKR